MHGTCFDVIIEEEEDSNNGIDGVFFYIDGDPGEVPESVQQMLTYMKHSDEENAVNDNLREIHQMVHYVRTDEIVEDIYVNYHAPKSTWLATPL